MTPSDALKKAEQAFSYALLGIGLVVFFTQLRSLYHFPLYDSYLWWGDESWLMLEFKEQMAHGILRHPLALGATIHYSNGLLLSNMWITAILYGVPQNLIASLDPVSIGRIVTGFLSIALLTSTLYILRKQGVPMMLASLALLLLITSRTFLLTSHSARYDILTALALLWIVHFASTLTTNALTTIRSFLYGAVLPLTLLISHHVLLLSAGVLICVFVRMGALKNIRTALSILAGALLASALLLAIYWLTTGNLQLLGSTGGRGFFLNVREMPILRPFSRSVQFANLVQRWQTTILLAPFVLAFAVIVFTTWLTTNLRQNATRTTRRLSPLTIYLLIVLGSWLFLESSAPTSYLVYVVPIVLLAAAIAMQRILDRVRAPIGLSSTALFLTFVVGVAISVIGYRDSTEAAQIGLELTTHNSEACGAMHSALIEDAAKRQMRNPLVLLFNPAVDRFVGYSDVNLMTTHFIEYPEWNSSPDSTIRKLGVQYILIYTSAIKPDYMREVQPIANVLHSGGILIATAHGTFTDIGRSYFAQAPLPPDDTLSLYRLVQ